MKWYLHDLNLDDDTGGGGCARTSEVNIFHIGLDKEELAEKTASPWAER